MIVKSYDVYCDLCDKHLVTYYYYAPTATSLRKDGFNVKINNGKKLVYCNKCYEHSNKI